MRPIRIKPNRTEEKDLQTRILTLFGSMPELRLFRANVGVAVPMGRDVPVRFGVVGQADVNGIVRGGRRIEIEVKSPTGKRTPEQVAWGRMVESFGGIYVVARSTDDVFVALAAAGVVLSMVPPGVARAVPVTTVQGAPAPAGSRRDAVGFPVQAGGNR